MTANSACHWFPRLRDAGLRVPQTTIIPFNWRELVEALDEATNEFSRVVGAGTVALESYGTAFIRTDLASAKHDGPYAYRVTDRDSMARALMRTIEDNETKFWLGDEQPTALLVREWIDLEAPFHAWRGHPVAREWRLFATPERFVCAHFYWPEDSVWNPSREDWRAERTKLEDAGFPDDLPDIAVAAANACRDLAGAWSVDFACDVAGRWWLIDMATAERSWHPEDCPLIEVVA